MKGTTAVVPGPRATDIAKLLLLARSTARAAALAEASAREASAGGAPRALRSRGDEVAIRPASSVAPALTRAEPTDITPHLFVLLLLAVAALGAWSWRRAAAAARET